MDWWKSVIWLRPNITLLYSISNLYIGHKHVIYKQLIALFEPSIHIYKLGIPVYYNASPADKENMIKTVFDSLFSTF